MKPVGKPDAGNRHVRSDERGWETGRRHSSAPAPNLDSTCISLEYTTYLNLFYPMCAGAAQNLLQFQSQLIGDKGFAQKLEVAISFNQFRTQFAGHQQRGHRRTFLTKARRQFQSIHAGHHDVGKQKVNIAGISPGKLQRFFTVGRQQDRISGPNQDCIDEISNHNIVFRYQDYSGSFCHATNKRKFKTKV